MLSIPKLDINAKYSIENCEFNYINKYNDLYAEVDEKYFINAAQLSEIEYQENLQKYKQQLSENFEGGPEKFFEYERLKKKYMPKEEYAHFEIKTPIFMAVENNNLEIIKHLLSNTNINTKIKAEYIETKTYINPYDLFEIRYHFNKSYKTILDVAISKGNEEIIALLRQ